MTRLDRLPALVDDRLRLPARAAARGQRGELPSLPPAGTVGGAFIGALRVRRRMAPAATASRGAA